MGNKPTIGPCGLQRVDHEDEMMNNDTAMQKQVVDALNHESTVIPGSIGVEVHHGVVKLSGCVSGDEVRNTSAIASERVEGVTGVIMDVDVEGRSS